MGDQGAFRLISGLVFIEKIVPSLMSGNDAFVISLVTVCLGGFECCRGACTDTCPAAHCIHVRVVRSSALFVISIGLAIPVHSHLHTDFKPTC